MYLSFVSLRHHTRGTHTNHVSMRYREFVGNFSQSALTPSGAANRLSATPENLTEVYASSNAHSYKLTQSEFDDLFSPSPEQILSVQCQYRNDFILAQACAAGLNHAWEYFLTVYRPTLTRAAVAIAGNQGHDLADSLAAELFGLTTKADSVKEQMRRSPLASYRGRGSLIGWLRTILAQRHVDRHRKTWRELPLETAGGSNTSSQMEPAAPTSAEPPASKDLALLRTAVQQSLSALPAEDRFLLTAYFLDEQTLNQIARVLNVHEATISRRLRRLVADLRKDLIGNLQAMGLSARAAEEALDTDPRDLTTSDAAPHDLSAGEIDTATINLRRLLQVSQSDAFQEEARQ